MLKKSFLFFAAAFLLSILSCKKDSGGDDNDQPKTDVTVTTLMGATGKRWPLFEATLTYYGSGGSVDSTVTLRPTSSVSSIYFTDNMGVNGLYKNYDAQEPLDQIMAGFGTWSLNEGKQVLNLACYSTYCNGNGVDGDWQITGHSFYGAVEFLTIERTLSLSGSRKVRQVVEFQIS